MAVFSINPLNSVFPALPVFPAWNNTRKRLLWDFWSHSVTIWKSWGAWFSCRLQSQHPFSRLFLKTDQVSKRREPQGSQYPSKVVRRRASRPAVRGLSSPAARVRGVKPARARPFFCGFCALSVGRRGELWSEFCPRKRATLGGRISVPGTRRLSEVSGREKLSPPGKS